MTVRWEQRIAAVLVSQHWMPLDTRTSAAVLVARTRMARWTRRAGIAVLATVTTIVVLAAIQVGAALAQLLGAL